jgi:hypothetical protein
VTWEREVESRVLKRGRLWQSTKKYSLLIFKNIAALEKSLLFGKLRPLCPEIV